MSRPKKTTEVVGEVVETQIQKSEYALARLENEVQMSISTQKPRDEAKILEKSLQELIIYPSLAEECIYSKPVGRDEEGKMKYAEGLSIRAAESLSNRWNNSAYGGGIVERTDEYVKIMAVFLDYENNTRHVFERSISKYYKTKNGQIVAYSPDRFDIKIAAEMSKILRETILRSIPAGLKREYELKAREVLSKDTRKSIGDRKVNMLRKFAEMGITSTQVETLRGKGVNEFTMEDITEMIGTYNVLKDGEITLESLFPPKETPKEEEPLLKLADGKS